jgi:CheY-like chemotaxis protein
VALAGQPIESSYDAVLVSNRLRDMGRVELIMRIRALDHGRGVPIVMVTGTVELKLRVGGRVVVANVGTAVGLGDTQVSQQERDGLRIIATRRSAWIVR